LFLQNTDLNEELVDGGDTKRQKENEEQNVAGTSSLTGRNQSSGSQSGSGSGSGQGAGGSGGSGDNSGDNPCDGDGDDGSSDIGRSDDDADEEDGDEDEDKEADVENDVPTVPSSNPGSPVAEQGNSWLSFEHLMAETYPAKSKEVYLAAYRDFELFLKSEKQFVLNAVPTETQLLNYFHYLKNKKAWVATSIWSQYSRLNGVLKRRFKLSLKEFPNVTNLLKSYEVGHRVKKASVFSPQQIEDMIVDPELTSRYWLVRKVVCLVGYYGGLRSIELRSIEFNKFFESGEASFEVDQSGYWFSHERGKQRGLPEVSTFCVPRRQKDWTTTVFSSDRNPVDYDPASVIDSYLETLESDLKTRRDRLTGSFFKSAHGRSGRFYRNTPMGKNLIERVGREFAEELVLPHPATYTSHCWRRTCGTNASDCGVNVTSLMSFMGWKTPKTAIGYVSKSRLSSFNMSMFLCNVQRQNSDLDQILDLLKPKLSQSKARRGPGKKTLAKTGNTDLVLKVNLVNPSADLASVSRTVEKEETEASNLALVKSINERVDYDENNLRSEVGSEAGGFSVVDGGSASVDGGSVVGVVGRGDIISASGHSDIAGNELLTSLDPRVSSILSNLQNNGEIHVHFHFGNN
jgi:hypothetical protein